MSADTPTMKKRAGFLGFFENNLELVIAILLGVVSIVTAYASFQGALYGGMQSSEYQKGGSLSTEAESLYLEGNQQFMQDTQVYNRLTELAIDADSSDPIIAADALNKYETLEFQAVSEEFASAIERATEQNDADPEFYYSPLDDEQYQDSLFASYGETKEQAEATVAKGDVANLEGDKLTLYTVLMSISLFLLGIAALMRKFKVQVVLLASGLGIFAVSAVLTAAVPYVSL
jgi:hypothetical protein